MLLIQHETSFIPAMISRTALASFYFRFPKINEFQNRLIFLQVHPLVVYRVIASSMVKHYAKHYRIITFLIRKSNRFVLVIDQWKILNMHMVRTHLGMLMYTCIFPHLVLLSRLLRKQLKIFPLTLCKPLTLFTVCSFWINHHWSIVLSTGFWRDSPNIRKWPWQNGDRRQRYRKKNSGKVAIVFF